MHQKLLLVVSITIVLCYAKPIEETFTNKVASPKKCECVPFLQCDNGTEILDGAGLIEIRTKFGFGSRQKISMANGCDNVLEVCCVLPNIRPRAEETAPPVPLQANTSGCGIRNFDGVDLRIMSQDKNEAKFGEFPWMVAILHNTAENLDVYQCGGALIHRKVVLTGAHCVYGIKASAVKIRVGEWDTQTTKETIPHQDYGVDSIVEHESYHPKSLKNDFALLILTDPVKIEKNVDIVCLPESKYEYDNSRCIATGWGKNKADGQHQQILKTVELSVVSQSTCQTDLRRTILGRRFLLDDSFVCAGGLPGEDTCKGDGGSPLICPLIIDRKRFVQVGIVSWGIGCGGGLPGVYANILYARSWIDEQLMFHNLDKTVYQHRVYQQ